MDFQKFRLKDIAGIDSGYSFRTKIMNNPDGNYYAIQMRDISEDRTKINQKPHKVYIENLNSKHLLKHGDLLFAAKGSNNYAIFYNMEYKPAVASAVFFIIRPDKKKILPEYLYYVINSPIGQSYLQSNQAGTYIPNINKRTLTEMNIFVPPLEVQHKIVEFLSLIKKEEALLNKIDSKRELIGYELTKNILTGKINFKDEK